MKLLDAAKEVAALAAYNITGADAQAVSDKARAIRRVNLARSKVASKFSGRWASLYREGWLPLVPVYGTGTVAVTQDSRTVTGSGTTWTSAMVGRKFLGPNNEYYKIAAVASTTSISLTEPYQGATVTSGGSYQIWKDEYTLYPDAYSLIDFVNYVDPLQLLEDTNRHGRNVFPRATYNTTPQYFSIVGRTRIIGPYATGTVAISANSRTLTGSGTLWLDNVQPGYEVTIGSYTYHVDTVDSDTQLTLIEYAVSAATAGTAYTATGRNALKVRFLSPSSQTIVSYGYYSKVYPLVNDSDEDWMLELYPHLIIDEVVKNDYLDKDNPTLAVTSAQLFDKDLQDCHMADAGQYGGVSVVGLDIPDSARQ
jgi:hypothetical protein